MMECDPQELLPIAPPMLARDEVLGSGVKYLPVCATRRLSSSMVIPGWVCTQPSSPLISITSCMNFEKSMTTPRFTVWPERPVPPPRGRTDTPALLQVSMTALTSLAS